MYVEDKNGNRNGQNAWLHAGFTHIEFEEHTSGLVEAQVYHSGEFLDRRMTAKQIFQSAVEQRKFAHFLTEKQKNEQITRIERLKKVAQDYGKMNVWYIFDWGRAHGGYHFHRTAAISVPKEW